VRPKLIFPMHFLHFPRRSAGPFASLVLALAGLLPAAAHAGQDTLMSPHPRSVQRIDYQGWSDSFLLSNGLVEAVVVPSVGRIMQLRFAGERDGPFWENPMIGTRTTAIDASDWANFGGDKAWPSPQADWEHMARRSWPPPAGFDGQPMEAAIDGPAAVTLVSPIDAGYGIRVRRRIELSPDRPVMTVTTTYERVAGAPIEVAVWVITQLKNPVVVSAPLGEASGKGSGFEPQSDELPAGLHVADGLLSLTRDPRQNHKIGMRAATLVWIGATELLRIDSALVAGAKYPDDGCSAEVYTNADPLPYVELELLGPLARLEVGGSIERVSSYTLVRRTNPDPKLEVRRLLAGEPSLPQTATERTP
jgi:hypothetical protein